MLASDAQPLIILPTSDAFAILETANGFTHVRFEIAAPTAHVSANGSNGPVSLAPGEALTIDIMFDTPGVGLPAANVGIGVATPSGVFWVGPAGFTTTPAVLYSGPLSEFGPTTLFDFASTAAFPSGSYQWFIVVHDPATSAVTLDVVETVVP
jgi:hypothetical protein